jgi:hypothetical protein
MVITVIFPEFVFAKAVCELQMAVEDLHELKMQEGSFGWKVEYGYGCQLLHWLLHPHKISRARSRAAIVHIYRSIRGTGRKIRDICCGCFRVSCQDKIDCLVRFLHPCVT